MARRAKKFEALEVARHRNGVCGEPFYVVRFVCPEADGEFIAIRFEGEGINPRCAVLNVPMLVEGNIAFAAGNSWRGDHFTAAVDAAIAKYDGEVDARINALLSRAPTSQGEEHKG